MGFAHEGVSLQEGLPCFHKKDGGGVSWRQLDQKSQAASTITNHEAKG